MTGVGEVVDVWGKVTPMAAEALLDLRVVVVSPLLLQKLPAGETEAAAAAWAGGEFSSVACCRTSVFRRGEADIPVDTVGPPPTLP